MSLNKANIDSDLLKYVHEHRSKTIPYPAQIFDNVIPYFMRALVERGINPNTMKIVKVDLSNTTFSDFASTHNGILLVPYKEFSKTGFQYREGLFTIDIQPNAKKHRCGFYSFCRTINRASLKVIFSSNKIGWFIARDNKEANNLQAMRSNREMMKSTIENHIASLINTERGQFIYNNRLNVVNSNIKQFWEEVNAIGHKAATLVDMEKICSNMLNKLDNIPAYSNSTIGYDMYRYFVEGESSLMSNYLFNDDIRIDDWNRLNERYKFFTKYSGKKLSEFVLSRL